MRIYSNVHLSTTTLLYLSKVGHTYPGRWWSNYYLYLIKAREPNHIITYSPTHPLRENLTYYCYNKFGLDKNFENTKNEYAMVNINDNQSQMLEEKYIFIPKYSQPKDLIIVQPFVGEYPSPSYSNIYPYPILQ